VISTILSNIAIRKLNRGCQIYLPCQMPANYIEAYVPVNIGHFDVTASDDGGYVCFELDSTFFFAPRRDDKDS
jgi:hypothetical protein